MHTDSRTSQHGNALWFILVAIVLLAALTVLLSRSGTNVDQSGDVEQQRIKASQILRWAKGVESAVEQMKLRGISESDISFENTVTAQDYSNASCDAHKDPNECKIFATGGGGQNYLTPPSGSAAPGSEWIFTGANNVGTAAYPVGTTAAGTGNDLVMLLPDANAALCSQINRDMEIDGGIPTDATGIALTPFTGDYDAALVVIDGDGPPFELNGKASGCFTDTNATPDVTYFYYVVLPR
ncbi:MAG: hypothetical protein DYH13_05770 [Alphaproteobacteria bacterium PRO2]|nr:hypothetical protein [Alphaproteobacteria bacterium PRO2]